MTILQLSYKYLCGFFALLHILPGTHRYKNHSITTFKYICITALLFNFGIYCQNLHADDLPDVIDAIKPSIVGIGTLQQTRQPQVKMLGTGFAVADGLKIVTNFHVVDIILDSKHFEKLGVLVGTGRSAKFREARILKSDPVHDIAILEIPGKPLPVLQLADSSTVREGQSIAFTGFPIGAVLGLYPVTHTGFISAITPIIIPAPTSRQLTAEMIRSLREPFEVFQLDATAYPGNSGSPLFDVATGKVLGIINLVFVKGKKESVLSDPSAISYAIPVKHLLEML